MRVLSRSNFPFILVVASLVGCAKVYRPDLNGQPVARVRMINTHNELTRAVVLAGQCIPFDTFVWDKNAENMALWTRWDKPKRDSIGMPLTDIPETAAFTEQRIRAGVPITLAFSADSFRSTSTEMCAAAANFVPEDGADYEARFSRGQTGTGCVMTLKRLRTSKEGALTIESVPNVTWLPNC